LGETAHRVYERINLPNSLRSIGSVYRVLSTSGSFVFVPTEFTITRYQVDAVERANEPCVLLFSTIDIDDLERSRCVIACTLSANASGSELTRIADYLRRHVDSNAVLESVFTRAEHNNVEWSLPTGPGNSLNLEIETVKTASGFEATVTTDAFGLPQIATIIQTIGINGSVSFEFSDDTRVDAALRIDLRRINGPGAQGPVLIEGESSARTLRNPLSVPTQVNAIIHTDEQGLIVEDRAMNLTLEPGATHSVTASAGDWIVDASVLASSEIPEIRTFAEDINVSVLIVDQIRSSIPEVDAMRLTVSVRSTDISASLEFDPDTTMHEHNSRRCNH